MIKKIKRKTIYITLIASIFAILGILAFPMIENNKVITDDYEGALAVTKLYIKKYSYNQDKVDEKKTSKDIYKKLLENLDRNKIFLTKEELSEAKKYETSLYSLKDKKLLIFGYYLINLYENKLETQYNYAIDLIKKYNFNFNTEEKYIFDREELDFANNQAELNSIWDRKVLNDVERLVLAGTKKEEIKKILIKRYTSNLRNSLKLSKEEKNQIVINSYAEVFDPHNAWYGVDAAKEFEISNSLSLVGMGVQIQQRGETNVITKILKGGPAEKSNRFNPGDQFVYVGQGEDGELVDVSNYRLKDLVKLVRGEIGTIVRIGVRRDENSPVRIIKLIREKINQEDERISTKTINLDGKKVGYILIPGFYSKLGISEEGRDVSDDLLTELKKFNNENYDSLVVDLRNNGGGSLSEVIKMVGFFLGENKYAVQIKDSNNKITKYPTSTKQIWTKPLVVMINRNSASASEIFAGAIKDYNRGIIVGNTSWGKGSVQRVRELNFRQSNHIFDLGLFKYTINMFFRPNGYSTQIKGVSPHIDFPKTKYENENGEFKYKNALKWEKIPNTVKNKFKFSENINILKEKHKYRTKNNPKWKLISDQIKFSEKYFDKKETSLNLEKRKIERDEKIKYQKEFKKRAKELNIPEETIFVLDNGLAYNEDNIEKQVKREEILKKYIDPQTYEAANISIDLIK